MTWVCFSCTVVPPPQHAAMFNAKTTAISTTHSFTNRMAFPSLNGLLLTI
jgi:hypothetical protein